MEYDGTIPAPLGRPGQDGVLLWVWLHEVDIEVMLPP